MKLMEVTFLFKRVLFVFIIIVSILSLAVYAKEESDGYLFQFKDDDAKERAMEYLNSMVFLEKICYT